MNTALDYFVEFLPEYANDIKSNLMTALMPEGSPGLSENQIMGAALAAGYATRHEETVLSHGHEQHVLPIRAFGQ